MKKNKNVPGLRFEGFTCDWKEKKLEDICKITMGQSPDGSTYSVFPNKYILVQGNTDIYEGWVRPRIWTTQVTKRADSGDLIMSVRAPVGEIARTSYDVVLGRGVCGIKGNDFIFQTLLRMHLKGYWGKFSTGSTFESINSKDIINAIVSVPNKQEEANKIGLILQHIDKSITYSKQRYEKLLDVKKSMLSKMFPKEGQTKPELRFEGFTDDWKYNNLLNLNTFFTDGNYGESYPKQSDMSDCFNGVPFLTGGNLKNGNLDLTDSNYISKEKHAELKSGHLIEDDIILAVRGSLGSIGYARKENSGWNINSQLAILRTDKKILKGNYLLFYLLSDVAQSELLSRATGSALKQLPISKIKDFNVPVPQIKEQEIIASFFSDIDKLINAYKQRYEKLLGLKKSLLGKMFP